MITLYRLLAPGYIQFPVHIAGTPGRLPPQEAADKILELLRDGYDVTVRSLNVWGVAV